MKWAEYKTQVKTTDSLSKEMLEEVEMEASIISAIIQQQSALDLSHRDFVSMCNIPQSSVARIEANITPQIRHIIKDLQTAGAVTKGITCCKRIITKVKTQGIKTSVWQ